MWIKFWDLGTCFVLAQLGRCRITIGIHPKLVGACVYLDKGLLRGRANVDYKLLNDRSFH